MKTKNMELPSPCIICTQQDNGNDCRVYLLRFTKGLFKSKNVPR